MLDKRPMLKVMAPMSQSPHHNIEFFIIGAVSTARATNLLTKWASWTGLGQLESLFHSHNTNTNKSSMF